MNKEQIHMITLQETHTYNILLDSINYKQYGIATYVKDIDEANTLHKEIWQNIYILVSKIGVVIVK